MLSFFQNIVMVDDEIVDIALYYLLSLMLSSISLFCIIFSYNLYLTNILVETKYSN